MIRNHKEQGLTLIEVLIALAIVSIALTAVIKATSHSIQSIRYLQEKTIATWVAEDIINKVRVKLLKPVTGDAINDRTHMLGEEWYWHLTLENTSNKQIKKITVSVYKEEPSDNIAAINTVEGYYYEP